MTDALGAQTPPADDTQTPPWGDDFDAARAWQTILTLRQEVKDEKAAHAETTSQRDALQGERDTLATEKDAAEKAAADAGRALWVERAVRTHDLDDDLVEFITGADEETVMAQAERLASRAKPKAPEEPKGKEPETPVPGRPAPALTPGHGGEPSVPFDPDAVATAVAESRRR